MATHLISEELKEIENSHGGSLNHWVDGLMYITVQTCYDLQYITMDPSGNINVPTEPDFLALVYGIKYLMHHSHEPIMYSRNVFQNK